MGALTKNSRYASFTFKAGKKDLRLTLYEGILAPGFGTSQAEGRTYSLEISDEYAQVVLWEDEVEGLNDEPVQAVVRRGLLKFYEHTQQLVENLLDRLEWYQSDGVSEKVRIPYYTLNLKTCGDRNK